MQFVSTHLYVFLSIVAGNVWFSLRGTTYQNNSLVSLENIGDSDTLALLCMTDLAACCRSPHSSALGDWFFPNGTAVPNSDIDGKGLMWDFYRNRGLRVVRMIRRRGGVDGIYHCVIPVSAGPPIIYQNISIGVYAANDGECSIEMYTMYMYFHTSSIWGSLPRLGSPFILRENTVPPTIYVPLTYFPYYSASSVIRTPSVMVHLGSFQMSADK